VNRTALVVVLLLAACGEEEPDPVAEAEAGVQAVLVERLDAEPEDVVVTCPAELEVAPGTTFACSVAVADADPIDVDLAVDADGVVELRRAVVPTAAAETYLEGELAGPAEGPVTVDCGDAPLLVADVGDELRCDVTRTDDGSIRPVVVTVLTLDGTVRYRVEAPTTTTTTSTTAPPAPP
jgi:hypothetical protein